MSKEAVEGMLPVAEVIETVRAELIRAVSKGVTEPIQFVLGDVELELKVTASRETAATGGVKLWVLTLGGNHKMSDAEVQVVRLKLSPVDARARPAIEGELRVSDNTNKASR